MPYDHVTSAGEVRRFEVFTGSGPRRRWSAADKARSIAESYSGVGTVCDVARRHGPVIVAMEPWLRARLETISQKGKLAEAIRYALSRWEGLARFLDDGRIELDSNTVERAIRPIALNRKNALFAGSDCGGQQWAVLASLVETCKLNDVDPQTYLADVLTRLVNGHANNRINDLLPWAYVA